MTAYAPARFGGLAIVQARQAKEALKKQVVDPEGRDISIGLSPAGGQQFKLKINVKTAEDRARTLCLLQNSTLKHGGKDYIIELVGDAQAQ